MPNYSNSKIYKIINVENRNDAFIYVGSTTQSLSMRIAKHRSSSKRTPNIKIYKHILGNGGWVNFKIVLIESYSCNSKEELLARENFWQKHFDTIRNGLNNNNAVSDKNQYYEDNKARICEMIKQYRHNNSFKYSCEMCGYHTHAKDKLRRHITNRKHLANLSIYNFIHS